MIYGLYQSAAGMMANEYRQDTLSNNVANADTPGFKREIATFAERVPAKDAGRRDGLSSEMLSALTGGVWLGKTATDYSEGAMHRTDDPLDVALAGPGFFTVESNGRTLLTRDGRMRVTPDGQLVAASDGAAILNAGGGPITIDPRGGDVTIDDEGRIQQGGVNVGRLAIVDVANYGALKKAGASRFSPGNAGTVPSFARTVQGHIESSGAEPVQEMVQLLETSRSHQINAQMLTLQDQTVGRLIASTTLG